jgi:multisubunit Na+/H+ antiporter MnhF subunit
MSIWATAAVCFVPPLAFVVISSARGPIEQRFASIQLAGTFAVFFLAILSFAIDQASSIDLSLTLSLLTLPATLLFALFLERWL